MAVELTGTPVKNTSYANGNQAVTIPADAEAVIVMSWGWRNAHALDFTALNWDNSGLDFSLIVTNKSTTDPNDIWAYIMTSASGAWPGTGAKTLYWTFSGAPTEGGTVYIFFVKGLNTANPVRSTASDKDQYTWSTTLADVATGDLCLVAMSNYNTNIDADPVGSGQSVLIEQTTPENSDTYGIGYKSDNGSVSINSVAGQPYDGEIAFALRVAEAGGGGLSIPVAMHHYQHSMGR